MSLYKDASLVMIPSAYKDGKLYSIRPTDGSGDFTFSRGSNLAATRVDVNGLIEKGRENLLLQSNNFNTTWSKPNSTLTQGFSGYDGSNDAWKWASTAAATTQLSQGTSGVSGMRTLSIYAKAGSRDVFSIWVGTGIDFNLTTGQAAGHANASMESVGNGWWRCSYFNDYGTLNPYYVASAAGEFIYIMNAQAEQGLVATDYIETGASTAQAGILEDMPRLDYSGSCPALLLEPQRTNLVTQSEYFNTYSATRLSVTANSAASPEGVTNATKLTPNTTNASHYFIQTNNVTSGQKTTISFFAKADGYNFIRAVFSSVNGAYPDYYQTFDLSDGSKDDSGGVDSADIEPMGNGWYRCTATATAAASVSSSNYFFVFETSGNAAFAGNGTSGVLIYGLQVETNASYPTSYIPTYGSSVTRIVEVCNKTNIGDLIGQTQGTIFYDWIMNHESPNTSEDLYILTLSDGTNNNLIGMYNYNNTLGVFIKATTNQFNDASYTGGADGARIKVALAYANNDVALYINGSLIATDSSATIPALNKISLNTYWNNNLVDSTSVNQLSVFKTRLTNAELAALTTI